MKHVGLNVAADPLYTMSYTGVNAGMVIGVADDAGINHEGSADSGEAWDDETTHDSFALFLAHPLDEQGNVHAVQGDNRKLGAVEDEGNTFKDGALENGETIESTCQVGDVEV